MNGLELRSKKPSTSCTAFSKPFLIFSSSFSRSLLTSPLARDMSDLSRQKKIDSRRNLELLLWFRLELGGTLLVEIWSIWREMRSLRLSMPTSAVAIL